VIYDPWVDARSSHTVSHLAVLTGMPLDEFGTKVSGQIAKSFLIQWHLRGWSLLIYGPCSHPPLPWSTLL